MSDFKNHNAEMIDWCIQQHINTNHMYDDYLPYRFHLEMVNRVNKQFKYLVKDAFNITVDADIYIWYNRLELAAYGHDLIEDCRVSWNDVSRILGEKVADIIYAVSNEKGKTRDERANDKYYKLIRETPGAVYVKLCDRIANVTYSKMIGSSMYKKYGKENKHFMEQLGFDHNKQGGLYPMFIHLEQLFVV